MRFTNPSESGRGGNRLSGRDPPVVKAAFGGGKEFKEEDKQYVHPSSRIEENTCVLRSTDNLCRQVVRRELDKFL